MKSNAKTALEYISELPPERAKVIRKMRAVIKKNLQKGFEEEMLYGMIGYVVPFKIYPEGYHANKSLPLGYLYLSSQKNYIAFYTWIYAQSEILEWFRGEYAKTGFKLDMGKGCIRFKKMDQIPYDLIGKLVKKVSVKQFIENYEELLKSRK